MHPSQTLIRVASTTDVPAIAEGDVKATKAWLGKQIKILGHQIVNAKEKDTVLLEAVMQIFMRELKDVTQQEINDDPRFAMGRH